MKDIIPKKYLDEPVILAKDINQDLRMDNIIFITALLNGDFNHLNSLFTQPSSYVLEILTHRYNLTPEMQQNHLRKFPICYCMDAIIKEHAIGIAMRFAAEYNFSVEKMWKVIEILVKKGANSFGLLINKALSIAVLKMVIKWGADVRTHYKGFTALHAAAVSVEDHDEKISYLIEHGANVNSIATEPPLGTALHLLLANEDISGSIKFILQAKDKFECNLKDGEEKTPLILAAKIRSKAAVQALLETFKNKIDVNAVDQNERTALHFACAYGDVEMVRMLIEAGANINVKDHCNNTPLHYACARAESIRAMVESIEIHPDRDIKAPRNDIINSQKYPILLYGKAVLATRSNIKQNIEYFINAVNDTANNSNRAKDLQCLDEQLANFAGKSLIDTCMEGHQAVVEVLLQQRIEILATNVKGNKPSDIAQDQKIKDLLLAAEQEDASLPSISSGLT